MPSALRLVGFALALCACESVLGIEKLDVIDATGGSAGSAIGGAAGSSGAAGSAGKLGYRDVVMADSPVAYFRFDDTGLTAKDEVGKHEGSYTGAVTQEVPGAITEAMSKAVSFDGGAVAVPDHPELDFVGHQAFTVEAWVKPTKFDSEYRRVFSKRVSDANGAQGHSLVIHEPDVCCYERYRDNATVGLCASIALNQFSHVVLTFDGTTFSLYVNAQSPKTQPIDQTKYLLLDLPNELRVGTFDAVGANPLMGVVDELAFYTDALSPTQVQKHYDVGTGKL